MRSPESARTGAASWDVAVPSRPGHLPGVMMAGFSAQANELAEVALVPHPAVAMMFDLGDGPIVVDDGSGRQQRERIVAGLALTGARGRGIAGTFACLQVRLSPLIACAVMGESAELAGTVTALDDLWGRDAERTQVQLLAAGSWEERFAIVEATLIRRYSVGRVLDPEVTFVWRQIVAAYGQVRIERLSSEVGWSRKRLWTRFRSQIGLTPKRVAQLVRFDHAAHRLAAGHTAALAAADSGYVDQSHLHRDVVAFAGVTPVAVAAAPFLAVDDVAWAARSTAYAM